MSLFENLKPPIIDCLKKNWISSIRMKVLYGAIQRTHSWRTYSSFTSMVHMEPFICGNIFLRLCHTFLLNNQTIIQICKNQGTKQWDIYKAIRRHIVMRWRYKLTGLVYKVMKSRYKVVKLIVQSNRTKGIKEWN